MAEVKYEHNSALGHYQFLEDGSLIAGGNHITKERMQEIAEAYKGSNRIHKPMGLLFWTDCKNGDFKNWK